MNISIPVTPASSSPPAVAYNIISSVAAAGVTLLSADVCCSGRAVAAGSVS